MIATIYLNWGSNGQHPTSSEDKDSQETMKADVFSRGKNIHAMPKANIILNGDSLKPSPKEEERHKDAHFSTSSQHFNGISGLRN